MEEDYKVRKLLMSKLYNAGISEIELRRENNTMSILIHSSRLGLILGQKGKNLERISLLVKKTLGRRDYVIKIEVIEERNPAINAQILAYEIANKIRNRENYRNVQRETIRNAQRLGVLGIKIKVSGRLRGADIARSETVSFGKLPLSTLRAKLNYGFAVSKTMYGLIGIKV
ncbi:MAG: 30S ribosomal protein S3 [Mollicutes bacterium]|nr:MAG: 30S ribosomal protein S3 [Mollicutes bacterium]